jgi:hypothetical protein
MLDGTAPFANRQISGRGGLRRNAALSRLVGCRGARVIGKLHEHLNAISQCSGSLSLFARIGARLIRPFRWKRIVKNAKRIAYRYSISTGRAIPTCCRTLYIADVHSRARRYYQPTSYPGPVVYFRALNNPDDPLSRWRDLFAGELSVYPIAGNHQTIAHEPQLKAWAEQLSTSLVTAQSAHFEVSESAQFQPVQGPEPAASSI